MDRDHSPCRDDLAADRPAARGRLPGHARGGGRVDTGTLLDHCGEVFQLVERVLGHGRFGWEGGAEEGGDLGEDGRVKEEVVGNA